MQADSHWGDDWPTAGHDLRHSFSQVPPHLDGYPWSLALGDGNNGARTASFNHGEGIHGILSKARVPVGCLRVAMSAPVHSQHTMVCTQALGYGRNNCVIVTPARQTQNDGLALASIIIIDSYSS